MAAKGVHSRTTRDDERGFTLLELMVVVIILGILISVVVAAFGLTRDRAIKVSCDANRRILAQCVVTYQIDHNDAMPTSMDELFPYYARGGQDSFAKCPKDRATPYVLTPTGDVNCPIHPGAPGSR